MANLPETPTYDAGVFQLEADTPALGGPAGPDNAAAINLANRTAYLKQHVDNLESGATIPPTVAPKNSPALTGTPTAPTAALGDDSTKVATTAFVKDVIGAVLTKSVAGGVNVTLTADEAGHAIIVCTGAITANIALLLPVSEGDWVIRNATTGNYTLTVRRVAGGTGVQIPQGESRHLWAYTDDIRLADSGLGLGIGQTWQDMVGSRPIGTVFQNLTGRPISVKIPIITNNFAGSTIAEFRTGATSPPTISLDMHASSTMGAFSAKSGGDYLVPNSHYYMMHSDRPAEITVNKWLELR